MVRLKGLLHLYYCLARGIIIVVMGIEGLTILSLI